MALFNVELSDIVEEHKGEKDGKPYHIRKQIGYLRMPSSKYPVKFSYQLRRGEGALKPGMYTLDEASIYVDRFGSLAISPRLSAVVASAPAAKVS